MLSKPKNAASVAANEARCFVAAGLTPLLALLLCAGCRSDLDRAIERGTQWLETQQQQDGSWRSGVHGVFRDGSALTPHALRTVVDVSGDANVIERGVNFVRSLDKSRLAYPTYAAADTSRILPSEPWIQLLRSRQLRGRDSFPSSGGWAYPTGVLDPSAEANLSTTAYALCALADSGVSPADPAMCEALEFVLRCRNDDGGFRFGPTDAADNKAGVGISYGTTTADGLRAMLACGLSRGDPRVRAAQEWLLDRFDPAIVPGEFTTAREPMRNANYYYFADAVTDAFCRAGVPKAHWSPAIGGELIRRQNTDGSWHNPLAAGREDDATVATSFALRALFRCR